MERTVDVHNHLFPKEWIEYFEQGIGRITLKRTSSTSMIFYVDNMLITRITRAGHYDPDARLEEMDKYAIDTQILSMTTPSVEMLPAKEGVTWANKINDYFAYLCQKFQNRFYAYATLPYQDIDEATKELYRAYHDLGAKGLIMFSNINNQPLSSPDFYPVYEMAEAYELPIFIHPGPPLTTKIMKELRLPVPLFGFVLDTTMAIIDLIFRGVLERYPNLKLIHAHLGGVVPYMVGRIEDCFNHYMQEYGFESSKGWAEYYKRQVYVDSISYHQPAMKCCLDWMSVDHILLGTDYPHEAVGHIEKAIPSVREMGLPDKETSKILGGNAAKLFKLP